MRIILTHQRPIIEKRYVRHVAEETGEKSRAYRLQRKEGVAEGVRRLARGRAESAHEQLGRASGGAELAAAIHAARKDLKKLRAALRLVREELGEEAFGAENRRYRDAGRLLARSRDAEVKVEALRELQERCGEQLPRAATRAWREALEAERDRLAGTGDDGGAERIEQALDVLEAGIAAIPGWPLGPGSWKLVEPGLLRSYRQARREWKRTRSRPSAASVHEWRKRVKDLWYQLRIVRDAWPSTIGEMADEAHRLAELLGDHHDLALLADDLQARAEIGDRGAPIAAIEHRQAELLDAALELGARLFAERPKAFRVRMRAYWRAWRA